ncbi:MAG: c-type cytochrome domain-containing protein [Opitutus sp.]
MSASTVRRLALAIAAIAISVGAMAAFPLDGVAHGGALRLLGRFHPLLVHFPLGLLLLVPVLEWAGRRRPGLAEAAGFVLGLALIGAVASVLAGLALARADGHEGELVSNHLWGGIAVAIGTAVAWAARDHFRIFYFVTLLFTLGTLGWAAHQGGSLTHGAEYLTESLPALIKRTFRIRDVPAPETYAAGSVLAVAVQPILEKHCIACHGAEKQKGEYRMDAFATLLAGGKSGKPAVTPGQLSKSELIRRMLLEPADEKVMPPRKKPRPTAGEVALLRWWIKQGASRDLMVAAVKDAPPEIAAQLSASANGHGESGEPVYVARVGDYTGLRPEMARLERELGIKLLPVSRHPGDGLILRARGAEATFGDKELAQLTAVAPFIVEAELGGTQITDAGLVSLKPFTQLERLHLERTKINGTTLGELRALTQLSYLNLCATRVSDEQLSAFSNLPALRQLYLFGSEVTPRGLQSLRASLPECILGPVDVPKDLPRTEPAAPAKA